MQICENGAANTGCVRDGELSHLWNIHNKLQSGDA